MDILEMLTGQLNNKNVMDELSKATGAEKSKIEEAVKLCVPTLIEAMNKNANTAHGAQSLSKALDEHKNANVEDVLGFLKNVDTKDGSKMLDHIFGSNNQKVQNNISTQTGLKTNQVSGVLSMLAPLLLGVLGKQKLNKNAGANDLSSMLGGLLGKSTSGGLMKTVTNMLDSDGDGNLMDDLGKLAGGLFKK